jgi:hypothetical protein
MGAMVLTAGVGDAATGVGVGAAAGLSAASANRGKATTHRAKDKKDFSEAGLKGEKRFMGTLMYEQLHHYTAQDLLILASHSLKLKSNREKWATPPKTYLGGKTRSTMTVVLPLLA